MVYLNRNVIRRTFEKWIGEGEYQLNALLSGALKLTRSNPYRPENDRGQCIFIHVPRTGGTSIAGTLFRAGAHGHIPLYTYFAFDPERYQDYFKFSFVRNPYSRLVSAYHQVKHNAPNPRTKEWASAYLSGVRSFGSFMKKLAADPCFRRVVTSMDHFRPQWEFLTVNDSLGVDFLGRFEKIRADFSRIVEHLQVDARLSHKNRSEHDSYREYYQNKETNIVEQIYQKDFKWLRYKKEFQLR